MTDAIFATNAITAYHAVHALTKTRIGHMIRAKDYAAACKILEELDYRTNTGTIEKIIEAERVRVFEKFARHCPDRAVVDCVTAIHRFQTTALPAKTLHDAELALLQELKTITPKIKNEKIREYFNAYITAWSAGKKLFVEDLWDMVADMSGDLDGAVPLFAWWVYNQVEFAAVKVILSAKQYGFDRDKIMQSLGGLYERFN